MRNDFTPIHLKQANAGLDKHVLAHRTDSKYRYKKKPKSLWEKFLALFQK